MALPRLALLFAPLVLIAHASSQDRTITQVVKLLQNMLEGSQSDSKAERVLFAKYKCYVDQNEAAKKEAIENHKANIAQLENEIDELLASSQQQSAELAKTKQAIAANGEAELKATAQRNSENADFVALWQDLNTSMDLMRRAIEELAAVGADQTDGDSARDHDYYMANYNHTAEDRVLPLDFPNTTNLASLSTTVRKALIAASSLAGSEGQPKLESLLQMPFTGTYSANSGEVVGILKNMRSTFKLNMKTAEDTEASQLAAYNKFIAVLGNQRAELVIKETRQTGKLASNDGELSTSRSQLASEKSDLSDAESFLKALLDHSAEKTEQYDQRSKLRMEEQTAISEAISILNSDAAFEMFGKVEATSTGFLQLKSVKKHQAATDQEPRQKAQQFLQRAAGKQHAPLLGRIAALLQGGNPFKVVLEEIDKVLNLISAEGTADTNQQQWCDSERTEADNTISLKSDEITDLNGEINVLDTAINDPATGLLAQISLLEGDLQVLRTDADQETETRRKDNLQYQKEVAECVNAKALLTRAIQVLRKYYSKIDDTIVYDPSRGALLQDNAANPAATPSPPPTWSGAYQGHAGDASSVIGLLEGILTNSQAEENTAHENELSAQHTYEDNMALFRLQEGHAVRDLGTTRLQLAAKEQELREKHEELDATIKEKLKWENYLEKIKPGCDFITANLQKRNDNRAEEVAALTAARDYIKGSDIYVKAELQAADDALGDCLTVCRAEGEQHVKCKACLVKVSVPGYCGSHPTTTGCPQLSSLR